MFAIQNIKTGNFLYGTDYRYFPPHQRTSRNQALTYDSLATAKADFLHRRCGKDYRVVCLKTIEIKRIIDFDAENCYEIYDEDWSDEGGEEILREMQGLLEDINRVEIVSHLLDGTLLSWLNNWKMRMGMLLAFLIENERCKNERL